MKERIASILFSSLMLGIFSFSRSVGNLIPKRKAWNVTRILLIWSSPRGALVGVLRVVIGGSRIASMQVKNPAAQEVERQAVSIKVKVEKILCYRSSLFCSNKYASEISGNSGECITCFEYYPKKHCSSSTAQEIL